MYDDGNDDGGGDSGGGDVVSIGNFTFVHSRTYN